MKRWRQRFGTKVSRELAAAVSGAVAYIYPRVLVRVAGEAFAERGGALTDGSFAATLSRANDAGDIGEPRADLEIIALKGRSVTGLGSFQRID